MFNLIYFTAMGGECARKASIVDCSYIHNVNISVLGSKNEVAVQDIGSCELRKGKVI